MKKDKEYELKREKETKDAKKDMFLDVAPYLIIIFFIIIIRIFICTPVVVNGTSMVPTLHDGDVMLLYKLAKRVNGVKRFDIVVVKTDSGDLIKRVIGLPGDHLKYVVNKDENDYPTDAILYVNGKKIDEDFWNDKPGNSIYTCNMNSDICSEDGVTVKDGEYYVMGDNRENSKDSRMIGTISDKNVLGITRLIIFPFSRFGNVK